MIALPNEGSSGAGSAGGAGGPPVPTEMAPAGRHDRVAERGQSRRRIGGVRGEAPAEVDDGEVGAVGSDDGAEPGGRRQRLVPRRDVVLLASDVEADAHRVAV